MKWTPPYKCLYCGAPSWREPSDQSPPSDYCHEENHGTPDLVELAEREASRTKVREERDAQRLE